ncbi:MAG: TonB-dependent receptor plug domain-containing protein, partial [Gammaproteobacteria bacterium]
MPSTFKLNLHTSVLIGSALTAASALGAEEMPTKKKEPAPAEKPHQLPDITVTGTPPETIGYKATTATKTDTPLIETPQSISVITRDRIEDQPVQRLGDALRYVPGVTVEPFGLDFRFDQFVIRGFDQNITGLYDFRRLKRSGSFFEIFGGACGGGFGFESGTRQLQHMLNRVES